MRQLGTARTLPGYEPALWREFDGDDEHLVLMLEFEHGPLRIEDIPIDDRFIRYFPEVSP